mmetsp:Transcript_56031/g.119144  ORF Transcript_56031/g.119144 Transcript_56031/m.119144 type:complete len:497 (+) Transcript_56031:154-1644(+)|eukprot:CAMPEP_0172532274 /NCGR_PEP_ID=MMETSP1067-20121228/5389_1 /TAXON_ID=265564 ORGANISM="Thalassiosira punctigera, Strain Tpunct2005C2" /NCGR_SAMPLE_ID=MMETSP1067 /ASSEMBLY_ACC=CAM_ASM_000444 /LENGTH=496 /DNA_ID=CAMNT_0013316775 /DNA_START=116 /DNA_END=1606 /DNA_ORIENTATION=+
MAGQTEQHLAETLIDPENLDNPDGNWTKGEQQEPKCRDAWAAVLFYGQVIAIASVAGVLGVPAMEKFDSTSQTSSSSTVDYTGLIYASLIAGGFSLILSSLSLFVMSCCPKLLIKISLLFSLLMSLLVVVASFAMGNIVGGVFGAIFFLMSVCYACAVWSRIPFAAANLNTALTATKSNAGVIVVAYLIVMLSYVYVLVWMVALVGVYDKEGLCDTATTNSESGSSTTTTCQGNLAWGYFFLLLLSIFWSQQVFQNTIHTIIAGVVATWWFAPEDASSCCSVAIKDSFVRATTKSFGSICFGSLLVAIIKALRAMAESARNSGDNEGCAAFLLCLVECLLRCLEDALEYFNKFAYVYVGMYGYGYIEAGKNVITLFQQRGWSVIVSDNLIDNVLSLFCLIIGLLTGCAGLVMNEINPEWFSGYDGGAGTAAGIAFGFSFLVGLVISAITLSVIDSSVDTVLVCFAEGPAEFEQNHPELSSEMRDAWREVYPAECGF